jgi:hypothetical protein
MPERYQKYANSREITISNWVCTMCATTASKYTIGPTIPRSANGLCHEPPKVALALVYQRPGHLVLVAVVEQQPGQPVGRRTSVARRNARRPFLE